MAREAYTLHGADWAVPWSGHAYQVFVADLQRTVIAAGLAEGGNLQGYGAVGILGGHCRWA